MSGKKSKLENGTESSESSDRGSTTNGDVEESKETQLDSKEDSDSNSTLQESSTSNSAEQHPDLSSEINHTLSELLAEQTGLLVEKLNDGNQKLDKIKEFTENFEKKNLFKAEVVIHNLIQFYDTFVLVESQLNAINETFESLGNQIDAIPDTPQCDAIPDTQIDAIKAKLGSVEDWINERLSEEQGKIMMVNTKLVTALETLHGLLQSSPSPSQENPETEDESAEHQEESKDSASSLSQANAEMKGELIRFRNNLENARYEFEEALVRIGDVVPYKTVPDETNDLRFDRKKHTAVDSKRTCDEAQHLQVAESRKTGFYRGEEQEIFRHEEVTVYRYEVPADKPAEPDGKAPAAENVTATEGTPQESLGTAGSVSANTEGDEK